MSRAEEITALQTALAGEHAAIYGYGVAGAHLTGSQRRLAVVADATHRARRDQLRDLLQARGATPVAAAPGYRLPHAVRTPAQARLLAVQLEERLARVWVDAVADLRRDLRALAARSLQDAATRAAVWRGGSVALPGLHPSEYP